MDGGGFELLDLLLKLDPSQRPSATAALGHSYFSSEPQVDLRNIDVTAICVPTKESKEMSEKQNRPKRPPPAPGAGGGDGEQRLSNVQRVGAPVPRSQQQYSNFAPGSSLSGNGNGLVHSTSRGRHVPGHTRPASSSSSSGGVVARSMVPSASSSAGVGVGGGASGAARPGASTGARVAWPGAGRGRNRWPGARGGPRGMSSGGRTRASGLRGRGVGREQSSLSRKN